jgi:GNAT superfamily N-acetyltransferase
VDEPARRRGIGRALFEAVRLWAKSRDVRWLQWHAGTSASEFYAGVGVKPTPSEDESHPFYEIDFG